MNRCYYFFVLLSGLPSIAFAQPDAVFFERQEMKSAHPQQDVKTDMPPSLPQKVEKEVTDEQLAKNPQLINYFLNLSIDRQEIELIPTLLEMYQKHPDHDVVLIDYAMGAYLHGKRNYQKAISLYQKLLENHPDLVKVRFKLAQWLFEDKQFTQAAEHFSMLSKTQLPEIIQSRLANYQYAIEERNSWSVDLGLSYVHDNNINNAASIPYISLGRFKFNKKAESLPQKGRGLNYHLDVAKLVNITGHHNAYLNNQISGKYYWNNRRFNETENRLLMGYQFQNADFRLALLPLYEKRWFAEKQYSHDLGVRVESDYRLLNKWHLSSAYEYGKTTFKDADKNKYKKLYSVTLSYFPTVGRNLYIGTDVLNDNTAVKSENSNKYAVRLGWKEDWAMNIASRVSFQVGRTYFRGVDPLMLKKRKDREWTTHLTIWKKDWNWQGIYPKIQYRYQKIDSTLPEFFSFDKHQFNLLLEKSF